MKVLVEKKCYFFGKRLMDGDEFEYDGDLADIPRYFTPVDGSLAKKAKEAVAKRDAEEAERRAERKANAAIITGGGLQLTPDLIKAVVLGAQETEKSQKAESTAKAKAAEKVAKETHEKDAPEPPAGSGKKKKAQPETKPEEADDSEKDVV